MNNKSVILDMLGSIKMLTFRNEGLCFACELLLKNTDSDKRLDTVYKTLNNEYEMNLESIYELILALEEELIAE